MGIKLSEVAEESTVLLHISNETHGMTMNATIQKIVKDDISIIELDYDSNKRLSFDNVKIYVEYCQDEGVPIIWREAKVFAYKDKYVLQVFSEGVRHNRRGSFRVGVGVLARLSMPGCSVPQVMIRDISLTGFSITDRKQELNLQIGDELSVKFEDRAHILDLAGRVVRIEEHEDRVIYGLEICNLCRDLSSYISVRQRIKG